MKRNTMFKSLLVLMLVLALGSGTMPARQTLAQGSLGITGAASTSLNASLDTGFTYQGRLSDAGGPVDNTCALTFKLYDEVGSGTPPTGGTLLGTVTKPSEEVSDGCFTVELDFGSGVFTGDARWLEIAVDCGNGATTLSPRQELTAAPYALGLRPGAIISGTHTSGAILQATNSGAGSGGSAVQGVAGARSAYTLGDKAGVWGDSHEGYGVLGASTSSYGVFGWSSNNYGMYAIGSAGDLRLGGSSGTIHADTSSSSSLRAYSNNYVDIHLDEDSNSTSQFRVYNGTNTPVFTVDESGAVSWQAQTGYVSVSAAAFRPQEDGYDFTNSGWRIMNINGSSDYYYAPVQLPHGATVTRMTFHWYDTSSAVGNAYLRRSSMDATWSTMAHAITSGIGGAGSSFDDDILNATIDNSQYAYYLHWILPGTTVHGYGVVIQYTYTGPH